MIIFFTHLIIADDDGLVEKVANLHQIVPTLFLANDAVLVALTDLIIDQLSDLLNLRHS